MKKESNILIELKEHIPFTALATFIAIVITGIFYFSNKESISIITSLFYIFHPMHIFFSSLVTTAIFYKYKKNFFPAVIVGILGSIIIGSLSDIILPYLGGTLLGFNTAFHLEAIEEPILIFGVSFIGCLTGIFIKTTKFPHSIHVFLSVFATLFYVLAFSINLNFSSIIVLFCIVFIAVLLPCCFSDIVFPLLFMREK
ncbi:MAG: hypothetical protein ACOYT4_00485 [Nanoarchaeota archaeon]